MKRFRSWHLFGIWDLDFGIFNTVAIPTRIITLNIGSQTIGLAEFRVQARGGLVLVDYRLREIPPNPAGEGIRRAQVAIALREMMHELHIKRGTVNYAIAAQSVFLRFVKLPLVDEEKIDRIIGFEAQQNVPFPINEVVWDYQLVGGGSDEQVRVVIVAIKADYLEDVNAAIEESGLQIDKIGLATTGLYNAFRYNYSELSGCSLLVDIGARTTNLVFIEPGNVFFRNIPIGGNSITAAIAKEFGEPFGAAELRKKRDGFVSLGGVYSEAADSDVARVSKIARNTMTRLHTELMRSITHYRAQQQGSRPERIFLCGGSAGMPYMREFFHEKLKVPIEFFNPLRNVAAVGSAPVPELARSAYLLGEVVGLALRNMSSCPMELNLLPGSVIRKQELERRRPFFIMAAACFILALLGWSAYYTRAAQVTRLSTQRLQQKIDIMRTAETQLDRLKKQTVALDRVATPLITAIHDRSFWPEILEELNARLPEGNIWITKLAATSGGKLVGVSEKEKSIAESAPSPPSPEGKPATKTVSPSGPVIDGVNVRGLYMYNPKQQEIVVDYFRNLAGSPFFNINANKPESVIKSTSVPNDTEWAFPYELQLDLRKPVKLP
ncbi:MAG TPA: type IV pilus assembly protein PilM [Candidatus Binatus sp.]|nr:type IV pilus assembly protein PilM [Candidatus Binatus sp.]